jgi:hypothetical protein
MARAFTIQLTDAPRTSASAETGWPRWRVIAIRALYAPLAAYALLMASGAVQVGSAESGQQYAYLASTPWKLLSLGGALVILWTAGGSVLATQMLAVGLACWIALSLATAQHGSGLVGTLVLSLIFLVPVVLLRPFRRDLIRFSAAADRRLLLLAGLAAAPLLAYAWHNTDVARGLDPNGTPAELRFDMAGLGLILVTSGLIAALRPRRTAILPGLVGAAAVWAGVAAMLFPSNDASPGQLGGALLVAWGAGWLAWTWRHRGATGHDEPSASRRSAS